MIFLETSLHGAYVIAPELIEDERGFFARVFSRAEFEALGLNLNLAQCSISFNKSMGTLRGMHLQAPPFAEAKLVRCTAGAIHDVIVDLRPGSPTHKQWFATELTAANRKSVFIPEGLAHGFVTLADDTEVLYQISQPYRGEAARGVRWNDPAFGIEWPVPIRVISPRDQAYPDFES